MFDNINIIIDRGSLDRISLDRNCVLSLDRNYVNHLIEFFDTFHLIEICNNDYKFKRLKINHLIELFDQVPKSVRSYLAVDRKF